MVREYIALNCPTWIAAAFAVVTADQWNALYIPLVVGVISAVGFAYKAAYNRAEWKAKKHEAFKNKCVAIAAQLEICQACKNGKWIGDCDFEHKPKDCMRNK